MNDTTPRELPYGSTVRDLRIAIGIGAARAEKRMQELLTVGPKPTTPAEVVENLIAHYGSFYGWSLVALLEWLGEKYGSDAQFEAASIIDDIGYNGCDWGEDIRDEVLTKLAEQDEQREQRWAARQTEEG